MWTLDSAKLGVRSVGVCRHKESFALAQINWFSPKTVLTKFSKILKSGRKRVVWYAKSGPNAPSPLTIQGVVCCITQYDDNFFVQEPKLEHTLFEYLVRCASQRTTPDVSGSEMSVVVPVFAAVALFVVVVHDFCCWRAFVDRYDVFYGFSGNVILCFPDREIVWPSSWFLSNPINGEMCTAQFSWYALKRARIQFMRILKPNVKASKQSQLRHTQFLKRTLTQNFKIWGQVGICVHLAFLELIYMLRPGFRIDWAAKQGRSLLTSRETKFSQ